MALVLGAHVAGCGWVGLELVDPRTSRADAGDHVDTGVVADAADGRDTGALGDAASDCADACTCDPATLAAYTHRYTFDEASGTSARDELGGPSAVLSHFGGSFWRPAALSNGLSFDGVDDLATVGALGSTTRTLSFYLSTDASTLSLSQTAWAAPTSTGSPKNDWKEPQNAYTRDGRFTNYGTLGGFAQAQDYAGFEFALPAGAAVRGVEVTTTSQNTLSLTSTFGVMLSWDGGATFTSAKNAPLVLSGDFKYGGATDDWGHAFTASELGAPFRLRLRSEGVPLLVLSQGVDAVAARVHFAPIAVPRVVMAIAPGTRVETSDGGIALVGFPAGTIVYVDGQLGSSLGAGFHHVTIVAPSALDVSALSFGGPSQDGALLDGVLDDVRTYDAALSASEVRGLYTPAACAP